MRVLACLLIGLTAGLTYAVPGELAGTWAGKFTAGAEALNLGFDLDVAGDRLTGTAYIPGWGVYSEISDGRIEGNQFSFTVDRRFKFSGTVTGKRITLAIVAASRHETTLHRVESEVTGPLSADAPPKELEGDWAARFVGRIGDRPKMIGRIDFDFHVQGSTVIGFAGMGPWPGSCRITDGKVENGRFSFTATGSSPSSTGIPVMRFEGEIHGKRLKLAMRHQIFGGDNGAWLPMDGFRMAEAKQISTFDDW